MNTDTLSYLQRPPEKFLQGVENEKNKNYLEDLIQQIRKLSPFF